VVRSAAIEFLKPACFNDLIEVSVDIARLRGASMTFAQTIRRAASAVGNEPEILCEAEVRVASIDAATRGPRPLPAALKRRLEEATT